MANGLEVTKDSLNEFQSIQDYMISAREENATKTYDKMKVRYLFLKALLQTAGVNLTDIDKINE